MKKANLNMIVFMFIASSIFCAGCATDKSLAKKDMASLSPIKVVRHETPPILRSTMAETFFLTSAALALPGGSVLMLISDEYSKTRGEKMQTKIPDFGYLVMHKFVDGLDKEPAKLQLLTAVYKPVGEDYTDSSPLIEIQVKRIAYGYLDFIRGGGNGLLCKTIATMKNPAGDVLWQKSFTYLSKDFGRDKDLDEFEADDGKLLKEELEFAAEKTISDFIAHLNGKQLHEYASQDEGLTH